MLLPNNTSIASTEKGQLPLSNMLTKEAKTAQILPQLASSSLISLGQLCDDDCVILLNKKELLAIKNKEVLLKGYRNPIDRLWDIPVCKNTISRKNYPMPNIHPGLYPTKIIKEVLPSKTNNKKISSNDIFKQELSKFCDIIDHNILDNFLQKSAKNCKKEYLQADITPENPSMAVIIRKKQTHKDLASYLHAACFSPVKSTFSTAISKHFFKSWPGLTPALINRQLPPVIATAQGHLHQERQNLQSTKTTNEDYTAKMDKLRERLKRMKARTTKEKTLEEVFIEELDEDSFPQSPVPNIKTNDVAYILVNKNELSTAYTDLTGRFPMRSSRGNQYILIGYHYDANCIYGIAIKDRTAATLTTTWQTLHNIFEKAGVAPNTYVMDNEISNDLKAALTKNETSYQLVPPYSHKRNLAERAIQTWKNHFKAGLASLNPNFPLSEWDRLLHQANITLNLLRSSRSNPKISAYTYIFGEFNFLATPLAPPGTKIVTHIKSGKRGTWELNGEVGWYVGPSMQHYRCVECYFPRTKQVRTCDTVTFFPTNVPFPKVTLVDFLKQAATDIVTILTHPPSTTTPSLEAGDPIRNALLTLATQLKRIETIPEPIQIAAPTPRVVPPVARTHSVNDVQLPRVVQHEKSQTPHHAPVTIPVSTLQNPSSQLKNARFRNTVPHKYPLRSLQRKAQNKSTNFRHLAAQHLTAQHIFQPKVNHIFTASGKKETIDSLLNSINKVVWTRSLSNEWGRLAQGNTHGVTSTDTIDFIHKYEVPTDKRITYATYVVDYRPLKNEQYRVRITVGGDRLVYLDDAGSPAANLIETKLLVNSTISDAKRGAKFMSADIKDYFLATPMKECEYMKVQYKHIPIDIREHYNLNEKVTSDNCIYIRIKKGMYGLKQAAVLAYNQLKARLLPKGYSPVEGTVGLWEHTTRKTKFCLCVDDFGIKYFNESDATHLLSAIGEHYSYTTDWEGRNYCGLTFNWQYTDGYVDVSMPGYVQKTLERLQHKPPSSPQYSPHAHVPIVYATKNTRQYATAPDTSPLLSPKETTFIQSVTGSHLYYGRAIDYTILPALNEIASEQASPTKKTKEKAQRLMDYVYTYPNTFIRYYASDMVLHIDSDAAYLVAPKARSRVAGYFHLANHPNNPAKTTPNGAVHVECKTLRHVVSSAAEAETAGVFHNAQTALPIRVILQALDHPQPPTPIKTDNSTANGFIHDNIHQKRSKSWDMRYYWLRDRQTQQQFLFFWDKGSNNDADYFTKHFPASYHRVKRSRYVQDKINSIQEFQKNHPFPSQVHCEGVLLRSMTSA